MTACDVGAGGTINNLTMFDQQIRIGAYSDINLDIKGRKGRGSRNNENGREKPFLQAQATCGQ